DIRNQMWRTYNLKQIEFHKSNLATRKVQEDIGKEFVVMMASGTIRANVAAALATKKAMQGYGHINAP
ncbi:hypothetical protein Tco_0788404, partial [Tanacetum coccineum]